MNLLSLGTSARRLFAIHEVATANGPRMRAAVLCYPWGTEYINAHRAIRYLASRLALCGYHTLRFDYYGTGDSGGDDSVVNVAGCESDLETAMEALADIAGTSRVTLIGLRAGANIAANVAMRQVANVEALVLWDPIVSGTAYLRAGSSDGLVGDDLQSLDLRSVVDSFPERTALFLTDGARSREQISELGLVVGAKPVTIEFMVSPSPWLESTMITGALPVMVIQRVIEWLR